MHPYHIGKKGGGEVLTPTFHNIKKRTKTFQHVIGINISCDILIIISFK